MTFILLSHMYPWLWNRGIWIIIKSEFWSSDDRRTESDAYGPTMQYAQVGSNTCDPRPQTLPGRLWQETWIHVTLTSWPWPLTYDLDLQELLRGNLGHLRSCSHQISLPYKQYFSRYELLSSLNFGQVTTDSQTVSVSVATDIYRPISDTSRLQLQHFVIIVSVP